MRRLARPAAQVLALAAAATLAACVPPHARDRQAGERLRPVARLDCPDRQGELQRTSATADGKSCAYSAGGDVQVQLKLLPVSGDPDAALSLVEANLRQLVSVEPPAASSAPAESSAPARNDGDVNINLPGVQIHASEGGAARIRVGGIHIDADDKTNSAHIEGRHGGFMGHGRGDFTIDASDNGAIIRSRGLGPDVRQDLILASDKPGPDGWRAVGYEAVGPREGPLVVAIVQSRSGEHDRLFGDVKALVRRASAG